MASLGSLTEDKKQQAFEKARQDVVLPISGVKLIRITEEYYNDALCIIRDFFLTDEPLERAVGAKWGDDAKGLHLDTLRQNISLMIVNEMSGEIGALLTVQVEKKTSHGSEHFKDYGLRRVYSYADGCEEKAHLFDHFGVEEAVQLASLVTSKNHRHHGLASVLVQAVFDMVRHFGVGKVCIKGEGTSAYTQRIFEKHGMTCLYEGIYDEHVRDGRKVFPDTGEHKSIKIYGVMV